MRLKRAIFALALGVALPLIAWVGLAEAQSFHSGHDITISQDETINSTVWAAGSNVDIAGTVNGDIFCAGQNVNITGTVNGDIICAGQDVRVSGTVNGDVRLAGQTVSISSKITGSASIAGQSFVLDQTGSVGRDMSVASSNATLNGKVGRDLAASSGTVEIAGSVSRNVQANVENLKLGGRAHVGGDLTYSSDKSADITNGATIAGATHHHPPAQRHHGVFRRGAILAGILFLFMLLVLALAAILLLPRMFYAVTNVAVERPWRTLLVGFLAQLVFPVVFVALLVTVIGIPIALLLLVLWLAVLVFSWLFFAFYVGRQVFRNKGNAILMMLVGALIVLIVSWIPILNVLVFFAWLWMGSGMALTALAHHFERPNYTLPAN